MNDTFGAGYSMGMLAGTTFALHPGGTAWFSLAPDMAAMQVGLDSVTTTGGISTPNFFNGRVLGAEDMRMMLRADHRHRTLLGRALGPGVATGMRVRGIGSGRVRVTAGVAINELGETIELPIDVQIRVTGTTSAEDRGEPSRDGPVFADCSGTSAASSTSNAWLLTVRPDSLETGSAPADPHVTGRSCGPGLVAEGVRFRRVPLDIDAMATAAVASRSVLNAASPISRNILAHLFLGSALRTRFLDSAPGSAPAPIAETIQEFVRLEPCEVPLAIFHLQGTDIAQVDEWGVRRPCHGSVETATGAAHLVSRDRTATGAATFLQFQAQLQELLEAGEVPRAGVHFRYLPAVGILPLSCLGDPSDPSDLLKKTSPPFLDGLESWMWEPVRIPVASSRVESLVRDGTAMPPIDLFADALAKTGAPKPARLRIALVEASAGAEYHHAVFVAAHHPYNDRIDLDRLHQAPNAPVIALDHKESPLVVVFDEEPKLSSGVQREAEMVVAHNVSRLEKAQIVTVAEAAEDGPITFGVQVPRISAARATGVLAASFGVSQPVIELQILQDIPMADYESTASYNLSVDRDGEYHLLPWWHRLEGAPAPMGEVLMQVVLAEGDEDTELRAAAKLVKGEHEVKVIYKYPYYQMDQLTQMIQLLSTKNVPLLEFGLTVRSVTHPGSSATRSVPYPQS